MKNPFTLISKRVLISAVLVFWALALILFTGWRAQKNSEKKSQDTRTLIIESQKVSPAIGSMMWDAESQEVVFPIIFNYVEGIAVSIASNSIEISIPDARHTMVLCEVARCQMPEGSRQLDQTNTYILPQKQSIVIARLSVKDSSAGFSLVRAYVSRITWRADSDSTHVITHTMNGASR